MPLKVKVKTKDCDLENKNKNWILGLRKKRAKTKACGLGNNSLKTETCGSHKIRVTNLKLVAQKERDKNWSFGSEIIR